VTLRALPFYGSPKYRKRGSTSDTDFWLALLGFDFLLLETVMRVKSPSNQENSRSPATSLDFGPMMQQQAKILQPRNARAFVGRKA
jgi:hypothetical protein